MMMMCKGGLTAAVLLVTAQLSLGAEWGYKNSTWCGATFPMCCGSSQSPIDINTTTATPRCHEPIMFSSGYLDAIPGELVNNGHTVVFNPKDVKNREITGGPMGNQTYELLQFHFHWGDLHTKGAEHLIDGVGHPLEVHLVHKNKKYTTVGAALAASDGLAVLGFFFYIPPKIYFTLLNSFFMPLRLEMTPLQWREIGENTITSIQLANLFKQEEDFLNYATYPGSLTTPTCNEAVTWINYLTPIQIGHADVEMFRRLKSSSGGFLRDNFRPTQPLNGRTVYKNVCP